MTMHDIPCQYGPGLGGQYGTWSANQTAYGNTANGTNPANARAAYIAAAERARAAECKPIESSGVRVGEIIGWRMWHLKDGILVSYSASHAWPPNYVMKGSPDDFNDEGIWAFKEKSRALNKMLDSGNAVMGSVKMWGRVIEHTEGYRSEFAKITSLDAIRPRDKNILKQLREEYGL